MIESPRGQAIERTLLGALKALDEHRRLYPAETAEIYEAIAAHLRSAAPQSLQGGGR